MQSQTIFNENFDKIKNNPEQLDVWFIKNQPHILAHEQENLMNNWWKGGCAYHFQRDFTGYEKLAASKICNIVDWYQLYELKNAMINGEECNKIYNEQNVSWFQYGLLSHWSLLRVAIPYIEDKATAINLKNTLGQNALHVMAQNLIEVPRSDYQDIFQLISQYADISIFDKDINGFTPIDITKKAIGKIPENIKNQIKRDINTAFLFDLEKLALNFKLENDLKVKANPLRIKI